MQRFARHARLVVTGFALSFPLSACVEGAATASPPASPAPAETRRARVARPQLPTAPITMAIGTLRACVVRADGHVVCWGGGLLCGDDPPPEEPRLVANLSDAVAIAGRDSAWCALERTGNVACFSNAMVAERVPSVHDAIEVGDGCAILKGGSMTCWDRPRTLPSASPSPLVHLAQGPGGDCATRANGHLVCWESYFPYPMGPPRATETPFEFDAPQDVQLLSMSPMRGVCVKRAVENVECWGGEAFSADPSHVAGTEDAVALSVAEYHGCVLRPGGTVACWGFNGSGQLGTPRAQLEMVWDTARPIPDLYDATFVATGGGEPVASAGSTCVITREATVRCWGNVSRESDGAVVDLTPV